MPTGIRNAASVAPAAINGTMGVPGQILAATFCTGFRICGVSGGGTLVTSLLLSVAVTLIWGSATRRISVACTCSTVVPGKMRQLMLASARWGRALLAWPALSKVGMQVV